MAGGLIIIPNYMPALDGNGRPYSGALMYFYMDGTTTPQVVYADAGLTTPLTNPVQANNAGVFPAIYAPYSSSYSVAVTTMLGVPLQTYSGVTASLNELQQVDVRQFGAVGGNAVLDTAAIQAAISYLGVSGGVIQIPPLEGGALLSSVTIEIEDYGSGVTPIFFVGQGDASEIAPAADMDYLFDFQAARGGIKNLTIIDSPKHIQNAAWRTKFSGAIQRDLPCTFNDVNFYAGAGSTAWMWENDGFGACTYENLYMQNNLGFFNNLSGGVGIRGSKVYGLGLKYAARINRSVYGGQPEGMNHTDWYMNLTQTNSIGLDIKGGLHHVWTRVSIVQLGTGSKALNLDGTTNGLNFMNFDECYFEGSTGGYAIYSRGAVEAITFTGGGVGQGGYAASNINAIDIDSVNGVTFQGFNAFFPGGNANRVFSANNCTYKVVDCVGWDRTTLSNVSTNCFGEWIRSKGTPTVRTATDSYPQAPWSEITGLAVSSSGGALGAGATATLNYTRDGVHATGTLRVLVPLRGTGSGNLRVTLPSGLTGVNTRDQSGGVVREYGVTNTFGFGAYIAGNTVIITTTAGAFPCAADGYNFSLQMSWEIAS